jgi:hypothetical protein
MKSSEISGQAGMSEPADGAGSFGQTEGTTRGAMARTRQDGCPWAMDGELVIVDACASSDRGGGREKGDGFLEQGVADWPGVLGTGKVCQCQRNCTAVVVSVDGGATTRGWREEGVSLLDSSDTDVGEAFVNSAKVRPAQNPRAP